jgi:hypothetical protein
LYDEPEIVLWNADAVLATWRTACIVVWRVQTSVDALVHLEALLARQSGGQRQLALLQVLEPTVRPLDSEQRSMLETVMRSARALRCSAVVYEGSGFQAAAVRAVVAGVAALQRHPFPHRVFADVPGAAEFHAAQLNQVPDYARGLTQAVRYARAWRASDAEGLTAPR